jgi:hypothetical protein
MDPALHTQTKQDPSCTDPVDFEGVLEEMDRLAPWAAVLPGISGIPVSFVVLDIQDIVLLAQEERAVGNCEDLAQPVLLTH